MPYKRNKQIYAKIGFLALFMMMNSLLSFGQSVSDQQKSFEESYVFEQNGNYQKAISVLKSSYMESSYEYNLRLGWLDYLAGQFTESESYYRKAISLKPMSIEARYGLVYPLLALGKTVETRVTYQEILEISPLDTQANYRLGLIYYQQEKYKDADVLLKKMINLYPFDYNTLILLAWNSLMMGKVKEAEVLFNKTLLYNPNDESALKGLETLK